MGSGQQLIEICSFHPDVLSRHQGSTFHFYAYNLSTGHTIPVFVRGSVLSLNRHDIMFSRPGPLEADVVANLQRIIAMPVDDTLPPEEQTENGMMASLQHTIHTADDPPKSYHASKYRQCLHNVLSLYSSCIPDTTGDLTVPLTQEQYASSKSALVAGRAPNTTAGKVHEIAFIELTFSIDDNISYSNNFAAIVPISGKGGKLTVLLPYNGSLWEEVIGHQKPCFIKSTVKPGTTGCDVRVTALRKVYSDRLMMMAGKQLLIPFVSTQNDRETRENVELKKFMYMHLNTETYLMLYGTLVSIGRSHELMTEHEMNILIVQNILLTTVNIFGYAVDVLSHDLMDNFFSVMCYCMHIGQLGNNGYREDITGEDIRKR